MSFPPSSLNGLRPNPDWAKLPIFGRKGWKRLPFGAFVDNINERVEPADAADEVYVGLDDLDPGSLHIRRWGKGSDVIGTKLRFRKGDIIFGRRRAYQRKLAIAEMDGICSAHAMVVRAKPDMVLPEFLPFLMMSDRFMNRAVEISVGSLSPTINWTTLRHEGFDLPPVEQQRRIAGILWAGDEALERYCSLKLTVDKGLQAQISECMRGHVLVTEGNRSVKSLGDAFGERREKGFGDLPILSVTIAGQVVRRATLDRNVIDRTGTEKYLRVCPHDIVYNTMRMWQGSCGVVQEEGIVSPAYTILTPRTDIVDPIFWNYAFHTLEFLQWFQRLSTGVAADRWRLYYKSFARIPARIPPLSYQQQKTQSFEGLKHIVSLSEATAADLWSMLLLIVNRLFSRESKEDA